MLPAGRLFTVVNAGHAPWIEELYALNVTGGCKTAPLRYCPGNPNSRGEIGFRVWRYWA
jgi:hypothetical protein